MLERMDPSEPRPRAWTDRRLWLMAAFGFVAGLPLPLSGFTLRQWLAEGGAPLAVIGLTANIALAYSLKFLWAPSLDNLAPPGPLRRLGRRRGWLAAIQPALVLAAVALALSNPAVSPGPALAAAAAVAFLSATQDIAIDAWRIEVFPARLQGMADAAFLTYLSGLCSLAFTATHYALLSSLASIAIHTLGGLSGVMAAAVGWKAFYALCMLAALPSMGLMLHLLRRFPPAERAG